MAAIGATIRQAREAAGVSQQQLADLCGKTSRSGIARIESGERRVYADDLVRIATLLDIDLNQLKEPPMT